MSVGCSLLIGASCLLNGASCLLNMGRLVLGRVFFGRVVLGRVVFGASCPESGQSYNPRKPQDTLGILHLMETSKHLCLFMFSIFFIDLKYYFQ